MAIKWRSHKTGAPHPAFGVEPEKEGQVQDTHIQAVAKLVFESSGFGRESAWSYFRTQGEIWLADPACEEGGGYFNR